MGRTKQAEFLNYRSKGVFTFPKLGHADNLLLPCYNYRQAYDITIPQSIIYPADNRHFLAAEERDWAERSNIWKSQVLKRVRTVPTPAEFNSAERRAAGSNLYKRLVNSSDDSLKGDHNLAKMRETPCKTWGGSPTATILKFGEVLKKLKTGMVPPLDRGVLEWLLRSYASEPWDDGTSDIGGGPESSGGKTGKGEGRDDRESGEDGRDDDDDDDDEWGNSGESGASHIESAGPSAGRQNDGGQKSRGRGGNVDADGLSGDEHPSIYGQLEREVDPRFVQSFHSDWLASLESGYDGTEVPDLTQDLSGLISGEGYDEQEDAVSTMLPPDEDSGKEYGEDDNSFRPEYSSEDIINLMTVSMQKS